jgi:hypothetical protein
MNRMTIVFGLMGALFVQGCGWFKPNAEISKTTPSAPKPPRVFVKRVPCKIKVDVGAVTLEVNVGEMKDIILDAKQLYHEIIHGETTIPERGQPVVMVINKEANKYTCFQITPTIKEIRLKNKEAKGVELVVKNQDPLQVELWTNSPTEFQVDIEFKDSSSSQ